MLDLVNYAIKRTYVSKIDEDRSVLRALKEYFINWHGNLTGRLLTNAINESLLDIYSTNTAKRAKLFQ